MFGGFKRTASRLAIAAAAGLFTGGIALTPVQAADPGTYKPAKAGMEEGFTKSFTIGGLIEVEATFTQDFDGVDASDITLATVELYFDANPSEHVATHILLLYEDEGPDSQINLDEAFVTLGNMDSHYLQAGQAYVPFARAIAFKLGWLLG